MKITLMECEEGLVHAVKGAKSKNGRSLCGEAAIEQACSIDSYLYATKKKKVSCPSCAGIIRPFLGIKISRGLRCE